MEDYLKKNREHWNSGNYDAPNVESWIFRFYGRILKWEFGMDGSKHNNILDFGCGEGGNLKFFKNKGFNIYGVDISKEDIENAKNNIPDIKEHLKVIDSKPTEDMDYFGIKFDLIIANQSAYYFNDTDLKIWLKSINNMLNPGGIVFFSMMGTRSDYYPYSKLVGDGLSVVNLKFPRYSLKDYYMNFTESEEDLIDKFSIFKKLHVGYYAEKYREDEPEGFHYIFIGQKIVNDK